MLLTGETCLTNSPGQDRLIPSPFMKTLGQWKRFFFRLMVNGENVFCHPFRVLGSLHYQLQRIFFQDKYFFLFGFVRVGQEWDKIGGFNKKGLSESS